MRMRQSIYVWHNSPRRAYSRESSTELLRLVTLVSSVDASIWRHLILFG